MKKILILLLFAAFQLCDLSAQANLYGGWIENATAGENITAPAAVYIDSGDGKAYKANATTTANRAIGIVFADAVTDGATQIAFSGIMVWPTTLTMGLNYYLSAGTSGAITTTAPANVQLIGRATSAGMLQILLPEFASTGGGSGTVTATGGSLTANAVVLGAGATDTKASTGITTDGGSALNLGVNATTIGKVKMFGNTSGDVTIQPTAAAGTATVQTLPATTGTLVNRVTTANGVSASNSDGALSVTLGAITPTTVNGHTFTTGSSTFTGTAGQTYTFPATTATIARTDAANTFTGIQTFSTGISLTGTMSVVGQYNSTAYPLTDGATIALNWNSGNVQTVTLGGSRTFTFSNPLVGGRYLIVLKQDATGSRTITWPTIKWRGGTAPTLTTTANKYDLITLIYDGTNYYGDASLNY